MRKIWYLRGKGSIKTLFAFEPKNKQSIIEICTNVYLVCKMEQSQIYSTFSLPFTWLNNLCSSNLTNKGRVSTFTIRGEDGSQKPKFSHHQTLPLD
jgi:hypothetical protein